MALTPTVSASQLAALAATESNTELQVSQFSLMAAANFATPQLQVSQIATFVAANVAPAVQASQLAVMVAAIGRPTFRRARAWTFTLDSHDFYVLRIGESETLIYDLTTGQWALWRQGDRSTWRAHLGQNWLGAEKANYLGGVATNVVAGDDTFGVLWTLDPAVGIDDPPLTTQLPQPFTRIVTAGIPMRMRQSPRQNALFLTVETGVPLPSATDITLLISDDQGNTFTDMGTVTLNTGDFGQEVRWRSLGLIRQPGRIMEFRDTGAAAAFYSLDTRVDGDTQ